jgi:hypothetical protein
MSRLGRKINGAISSGRFVAFLQYSGVPVKPSVALVAVVFGFPVKAISIASVISFLNGLFLHQQRDALRDGL